MKGVLSSKLVKHVIHASAVEFMTESHGVCHNDFRAPLNSLVATVMRAWWAKASPLPPAFSTLFPFPKSGTEGWLLGKCPCSCHRVGVTSQNRSLSPGLRYLLAQGLLT